MELSYSEIKQEYPEYHDDDIDKSLKILDFLIYQDPEALSSGRKKGFNLDTKEGLLKIVKAIIDGRYAEYKILTPKTIVDPATLVLMRVGYGYDDDSLLPLSLGHQQFMLTENLVGALLENYIASKLEPIGWIWCSGSVVKATDFIYPKTDAIKNTVYDQIQIKNRNNTENSSSSKIRSGTSITKWYRLMASNGNTRWDELNKSLLAFDNTLPQLTEEDFLSYIANKVTVS